MQAYPVWAYYAHGRQRRCQGDPVSLPSGRLEKTTRSSLHHVAQHRPTGSETTPPYIPRSSRFGSELPCMEDDVDIWRYAIVRAACQKRRRWFVALSGQPDGDIVIDISQLKRNNETVCLVCFLKPINCYGHRLNQVHNMRVRHKVLAVIVVIIISKILILVVILISWCCYANQLCTVCIV